MHPTLTPPGVLLSWRTGNFWCRNWNRHHRVPYNKELTNRACSHRTREYWLSVVAVRTSLRSVRTATTSGQYSTVRTSRSISERLLSCSMHCLSASGCYKFLFSFVTFSPCQHICILVFEYWYKFRVWVVPRVKDRTNDISCYFQVTFYIIFFDRVIFPLSRKSALFIFQCGKNSH